MSRPNPPKLPKGKLPNPHNPKVSINRDTPLFGMEYLDSTYSLQNCTKNEKVALINTIATLSKLSWGEIGSSRRHANGYEKIPQTKIRGSIPGHITPEIDLIAFRFCGMAPMVGYREGRIFHIIWLDRDFTLYDHGS